jgi:hypothetical protein
MRQPIEVLCSECEKVLHVEPESSGTTIVCPDCGLELAVPQVIEAVAVVDPAPVASIASPELPVDRRTQTIDRAWKVVKWVRSARSAHRLYARFKVLYILVVILLVTLTTIAVAVAGILLYFIGTWAWDAWQSMSG